MHESLCIFAVHLKLVQDLSVGDDKDARNLQEERERFEEGFDVNSVVSGAQHPEHPLANTLVPIPWNDEDPIKHDFYFRALVAHEAESHPAYRCFFQVFLVFQLLVVCFVCEVALHQTCTCWLLDQLPIRSDFLVEILFASDICGQTLKILQRKFEFLLCRDCCLIIVVDDIPRDSWVLVRWRLIESFWFLQQRHSANLV